MNENIDLTKILKDCPKGWKLYSPMFGEIDFLKIHDNVYAILATQGCHSASFTKEGFYYADTDGECLLFPSKDQRDWSKFTAPWYNPKKQDEDKKERKVEQASSQTNEQKSADKIEPRFKVGDWVVRGDTIAQILDIQEQYYVGLDINGKDFVSSRFLNDDKIHLWTINDAKNGDVLVNGSNIFIFHFINNRRLMGYCHVNMDDGHFYNDIGRNECFCTIDAPVTPSTKEQRDLLFQKIKETGYKWNTKTNTFEKLVEPKFKVGDKIVNSHAEYIGVPGSQGIISEITDNKYIFTDGSHIFIGNQDNWELVPDKKPKFDPKILKPFDRVLVIDYPSQHWCVGLFSYYIKSDTYPCKCVGSHYKYCIPYNDDTKHLVGTTEEAPKFYRYWEE